MLGGPEVRMRSVLLQAGVSFYELEKEPAHLLVDDNSRLISRMRFNMFRFGISLQDLKKDTLYENLEEEGWSKEDIEKEVKALYAMDNKQEEKEFNARREEEEMKKKKKKEKGKILSDAEWREYLRSNYYDDPHVQKDIAMYGDLDAKYGVSKKVIRKFKKIEKEKKKKKQNKVAGRKGVQSATIDMINT